MSLPQSAPAPTGPTDSLASPFEPAPATTKEGHANDNKKQKLRSLFGLSKKKGADAADERDVKDAKDANAVSANTSPLKPAPTLVPAATTSSTSSTPTSTVSKPLVKKASASAPAPASGSSRKSTSPIQTNSFSGVSAAGSGYSGYHVLPPSSPGRSVAALSSSPPISSPAGSQIFERDVQESSSVPMPNSPAIPAHIATENLIPPVLDASSEAITDGHLDPDTVEIITHANHLTVAGSGTALPASSAASAPPAASGVSTSGASGTGAWVEDLVSSFATDKTDKTNDKDKIADRGDGASNYGAFDNADVRRLSFISFADVVQAEQQQQQQQQQYQQATAGHGSLAGLASLSLNLNLNRSPSPMRSPTTTDRLGTSPPTSKSGSVKGLELSPPRKTLGSPTRSPKLAAAGTASVTTSSSTLLSGSDIQVETMAQALRRTASGDLGGVRSTPQSPI